MLTPKQDPFELTGNLGGDLEKDMRRFLDQPKLTQVMRKYAEVFGPLPPPGQGTKLVTMDIELKEQAALAFSRNDGQTVR